MTQTIVVGVICYLAGFATGEIVGMWAFVALVKRAASATQADDLTAKLNTADTPLPSFEQPRSHR